MRATALLNPPSRFLRTAHLERDFGRPGALDGYVPTPHVVDTVARIAASLRPGATGRAWRVTGDYGTGKSSLGLALAHLFSGEGARLGPAFDEAVAGALGEAPRPRLVPVLLTGAREGLGPALLRALTETRARLGIPADLFTDAATNDVVTNDVVTNDVVTNDVVTDAEVLHRLDETRRHVAAHTEADGLLLVIDELGKFLEHAALHPERVDIHLLQSLAEAADRSGDAPLVVVGLLHQGFGAYAEALTRTAQQEWEKVAGRFSEVLFDQPLEQTAGLAARALGTDTAALPDAVAEAAEAAMDASVALGWYGPGASAAGLRATAPALYPLHPTALPVLLRAIRRYGQNERSLFSFLLAAEPNGLREFAEHADLGDFYRLDAVYDYVAATYGHRIAARSARSHWAAISSLIDTVPASAAELAVLKAVGLLNLLNTDRHLATTEALEAAFLGADVDVAETVRALQARGVLFDRGARGGYCLWPHSSVDLEREYRKAREALGPVGHVGRHLADTLDEKPIVARRHYIETGTLRHVEVRYTTADAFAADAERPTASDVLLLVALCETERERTEAQEAARHVTDPAVVVAVPRPLAGLRDALDEAAAWRHVLTHTPALTHDAYAAEEASRQVEAAQTALARRLDDALGFTKRRGGVEAAWFHLGEPVDLAGSRAVLAFLSDVCSRVFYAAPRVANELINREAPSSAAVAARMRLIEGILTQAHRPLLGLPEDAAPPEKAMYLSILQAGRLHREEDGAWGFHLPPEADDPANLRPVLARMHALLRADDLAKVPLPDLFAALKAPPFGVREGLLHLLLAVFLRLHERDVAVYEDGVFVRRVTPEHVQRLAKAPERFALQHCAVEGVRADVFGRLLEVVGANGPSAGDPGPDPGQRLDVLGVVTPLCLFAAELPDYALQTAAVSPTAQRVREALLDAREPATLLFSDLPAACGLPPLREGDADAEAFAVTLRDALDELRAATPELRARVGRRLAGTFDLGDTMDEAGRAALQRRAAAVLGAVQDRDLKAFAGRLADAALPFDKWLDAMAALVTAKPLVRWTDDDEARFGVELARRAAHFLRTEAAVFAAFDAEDDGAPSGVAAVRVGVTEADGTEAMRVLVIHEGEAARLGALIARAEAELRGKDRLEQIALVRALARLFADAPDEPAQAA